MLYCEKVYLFLCELISSLRGREREIDREGDRKINSSDCFWYDKNFSNV